MKTEHPLSSKDEPSMFLSIQEVAYHLGVEHKTVRAMLKRGELGYVKLGKLYRIPRSELERLAGKDVT